MSHLFVLPAEPVPWIAHPMLAALAGALGDGLTLAIFVFREKQGGRSQCEGNNENKLFHVRLWCGGRTILPLARKEELYVKHFRINHIDA